jgi:hypothetical protein
MVTPSKSAANPNAATSLLLEFEVRKIAAITKNIIRRGKRETRIASQDP